MSTSKFPKASSKLQEKSKKNAVKSAAKTIGEIIAETPCHKAEKPGKASKTTKESKPARGSKKADIDEEGKRAIASLPDKATGWCFTLNNYTEEEVEAVREFCRKRCDYAVFGYEVAPTTGTPHLQGYFYKNTQIRQNAIVKAFPRMSLSASRGSPGDNRRYCKKGEQTHEEYDSQKEDGPNYGKGAKFEEFGELPIGQGHRTDLDLIRDKLLKGEMTNKQLVTEMSVDMYSRHWRAFERYENQYKLQQLRTEMTVGLFFFGKTGCGKSREWSVIPTDQRYVQPLYDKGWSDNYNGQPYYVMDEIRRSTRPFNWYCQLVDRNDACYMSRRGRDALPFISKCVILTSCYSPEELFPDESAETIQQFYRRFTVVQFIGNDRQVLDKPYEKVIVTAPTFVESFMNLSGTKEEKEHQISNAVFKPLAFVNMFEVLPEYVDAGIPVKVPRVVRLMSKYKTTKTRYELSC